MSEKSLRAGIIIIIGIVVAFAIFLMSTGANIMTMNLYEEQMSEIIRLNKCRINSGLDTERPFPCVDLP